MLLTNVRSKDGSIDVELLVNNVCKIAQRVLERFGQHEHICILINGDDLESMALSFTDEDGKREEYVRVQKRALEMNADFVVAICEAAMHSKDDPASTQEEILSVYLYGPGAEAQRICPFARRGKAVYCGKWERVQRVTHRLLLPWWKTA